MSDVSLTVNDQIQLNRWLWRELVFLRANLTCESCGVQPYGDDLRRPPDPNGLDAHHINGDDSDNRLINGSCVCGACHARITMTGRKRKMSDEWRENVRQAGQKRKGKITMSDATRTKISIAAKERCSKPEFRAKAAERQRKLWANPEFRSKASAGMRKAWAAKKESV